MNKQSKIIICTLALLNTIQSSDQIYKSKTIEKLEHQNKSLEKQLKSEQDTNSKLDENINILNKQYNLVRYDLDHDGFKDKVYFDANDITIESNATREQLLYALRGTKLIDYVDVFLQVEQDYNINTFFIIGLVANESGWLTSNRTVNQNNVTGYAVYSNSSKGRTFSSIDESILTTAKTISENYINPNGEYHKGLSTYDINISYSADPNWHKTINSISKDIVNNINEFTDFLYN